MEADATSLTVTRTFRLPPDLSAKLSEVLAVEGITSAEFLDPLTRVEIENRHRANLPAIRALRAARERSRKARGESSGAPTNKG